MVQTYLGLCFSKLEKQELAINDFTSVLLLDSDHINAAFARAACYNTIGQFSKAIEDYNFALSIDSNLRLDSNRTESRRRFGSTLPPENDFSTRFDEEYANSKVIIPDSDNISVKSNQQDEPISLPVSTSTITSKPTINPTSSVITSSSSIRRQPPPVPLTVQRLSPINRDIKDNTEISDDNLKLAEEHHSIGFQHRRENNFYEAIEEYSKAIKYNPKYFKAYFNRGFAYDKIMKYTEAVSDYTSALSLQPTNAYTYYNRGKLNF